MLTRDDLEILATHEGTHPVLSLYINLDPRQRGTDAYRVLLRGLLKQAADGGADPDDVEAVDAYFAGQSDWSGRSVVIFASSGDGLWRVEHLSVPVHAHLHVGRKPYIKPLVDLIETYGSYCVAVVDKQVARLYHFHLGDLIETEMFEGEDVRRVKAGGGSSAGMRAGDDRASRHEDQAARNNLREAANITVRFCRQHGLEHILVGGSEQTRALFRQMLPQAWQNQVEAEFSIEAQPSDAEVREQSLDALLIRQRERQASLVRAIITAAAKGGNGVIRLDDTLGALYEGRVQTLAVVEDYHAPGYHCTGCGYVTAQAMDDCPFCGASFEKIRDAVEHAIRQTVDQGGDVEVVDGDSELNQYGQIGALLRY
jgi:peptide chain release factor subunit 1